MNGGWEKQLLHIWAQTPEIVEALEAAYNILPASLTADTVCLVTLCTVPELYNEKRQLPKCTQRTLKVR